MPGVKYNGRANKINGKARKYCCCVGSPCCEDELPSRFDREGLSPTTPAEAASVLLATVTQVTNGCATLNDFQYMYEDSPFVWATRVGQPLVSVGDISGSCGADGFTFDVFGCPSSSETTPPTITRQCTPPLFVLEYTVFPFDLACPCPMTGGSFTVTITRYRKYGDPYP